MSLRLLVLLGLCAGCGRLGFDAVSGDAGADAVLVDVAPTPVTVATYEATMSVDIVVVPITPVDPSRTLVLCDFRTGASSMAKEPTCALTGPSTVTITAGLPDPTGTVRVQVIELSAGAQVQRGTDTVGSGAAVHTIAIQPVDRATSFLVVGRRGNLDSPGFEHRFNVAARFLDAQTIELSRSDTGNTVHIEWQVVQLPGSRVHSGLTGISDGQLSATATLQNADLSRAAVFLTTAVDTGNEGENLVRATLTSPSQLVFTRSLLSTNMSVSWFVVEFPDVESSQSSAETLGTALSLAVPILQIDPTRSAVFLTHSGGRTAAPSETDEIVCTGTLTATQLLLERNPSPPTDVNGKVAWTVLQWNK